jgi:hypothetical protein
MNDDDLARLLRGYEPVGPPASLRARVVGKRTNARRTWPWAAAAAALLTVSVWLGSSAESVMQRAEVNLDVAETQRALEVEALSELVGDAENPRARAEWMIERRDADRALESPRQAVGTTGAGR